MTISRKGRRPLTVGSREYLWYVGPDTHDCYQPMLTVVSSDRRVFLRYHLSQSDETRFVIVVGPEFRVVECGGVWRRFRCPQFGTTEIIAPADVRALIDWALGPGPAPVEVDWKGRPLNSTSNVAV